MPTRRDITGTLVLGAVLALLPAAGSAAAAADFVLIDRGLRAQPVRVTALDERTLVCRDETGTPRPVVLERCLALAPSGPPKPRPRPATPGVLRLTDGQRLPGGPAPGSADANERLAWVHPWLGPVDVPLDRVAAVTFRPGPPVPKAGSADVVVLVNGDRLEGFVTGLGDPISIEVEVDGIVNQVRIPRERAAGAALVAPSRPPGGRRVWFLDGTVLDVRRLEVGEDGYLGVETDWILDEDLTDRLRLSDVAAILFAPARLVPLGTIAPSGYEAPPFRFYAPRPRPLDANAPLDLGRIEYRGPVLVRYTLPERCRRFAAAATLPAEARHWGDFELIVRDDDREVYRMRMSGAEPEAEINVALAGSELTIELTRGANGPIDDRLVLSRALLLTGP